MELPDALPCYDQEQIEAVRSYVGDLKPREIKAVFLRFWGPCSIEEVARELGVSWDHADRMLDRALKKLRAVCERDPVFNHRRRVAAA